jgi:uncharacterized protein YcbK (DUF882 family)
VTTAGDSSYATGEVGPAADSGVSRRGLLRLGLGAALALTPLPALAARTGAFERSLAFLNEKTGERLKKIVYWEQGQYLPDAMAEIDKHLRDFRTGDVHRIDPRLLDLLNLVHTELETGSPFHVISGYRSPHTNKSLRRAGRGVAKDSFHTRGMAIDVRVPGRDPGKLRRIALRQKSGGVGYYRNLGFVHLDVGPVRYW